jgi:hypothetical protein
LKGILDGCQQLESIELWCENDSVNLFGIDFESEILMIIAKDSPKTFHELKMRYDVGENMTSHDLETFFMSWANRTPLKPISLIVPCRYDRYDINGFPHTKENVEVIEKYRKLGVIKEFKVLKTV